MDCILVETHRGILLPSEWGLPAPLLRAGMEKPRPSPLLAYASALHWYGAGGRFVCERHHSLPVEEEGHTVKIIIVTRAKE